MNNPRREGKSRSAAARRQGWLGIALGLAALVASAGVCRAQTGTQREYELKAGVLYHIIEYVEWPKEAQPTATSAIQIGLLGQIPFAEALEVLNGKIVQGRELMVKRLTDPQAAASCQVVFIGASEKPHVSEIMAELKNRPVLTVSEIAGFAENGGMVNLIAGPNRIIMEINHEVTKSARLSMSSQLLKLAKVFP